MSQSATGAVAFIQIIGANRITSLDSFNSQEFPLNHPRAAQLITHARLFYVTARGRHCECIYKKCKVENDEGEVFVKCA